MPHLLAPYFFSRWTVKPPNVSSGHTAVIRLFLGDATDTSFGKGNINEMLDCLMDQAQLTIGKNTALMTKEDKIAYIRFLDERGAFLITKSGPRVCEALGISKYTLYNYLEAARSSPGES